MSSLTPQLAASIPDKVCPVCGRRMQVLAHSVSMINYVCYAHTKQNSEGFEPYYVNIPIRSVDSEGKIKFMDVEGGKK